MSATDLQSDEFMTLLTDALRAGPGSPEWHRAVGVLRASGAKDGDEFQLLVRAREDLESGKDYRAVRAGAGFTRKVLTSIEEQAGAAPRGLPSANLIALLAGGVILAVVVVVAVVLMRGPTPGPDKDKIAALRSLYFVRPVAAADFDTIKDLKEVPADWKVVGDVPLQVSGKALRPLTTQPTNGDKREYRAGALQLAESLPADQPALVEANLRVARAGDAVVPQVFVSEGPLDEKAAARRELVWVLKGGQPQVYKPTDGDVTLAASGEKIKPAPATLQVKIRLDRETVIVETNDGKLYEGPHQLSADKPRTVGVRFLRKTGDGSDGAMLTSVRVLKP